MVGLMVIILGVVLIVVQSNCNCDSNAAENKEETGKTRIGLFLQNIAPALLNVAGDLTGIKALTKIGEAVSGTTSLNPEQKAEALVLLKLDLENERERTKRHEIDMASDSFLSKNVRPATLIYLIISLTALVFSDAGSEKRSAEH